MCRSPRKPRPRSVCGRERDRGHGGEGTRVERDRGCMPAGGATAAGMPRISRGVRRVAGERRARSPGESWRSRRRRRDGRRGRRSRGCRDCRYPGHGCRDCGRPGRRCRGCGRRSPRQGWYAGMGRRGRDFARSGRRGGTRGGAGAPRGAMWRGRGGRFSRGGRVTRAFRVPGTFRTMSGSYSTLFAIP